MKPNKTNLQNIKKNSKLSSRVLFLNLDSATTYLPGRLPSEYCRREKSLRPCSGWERVVSFCFVTDKSFSDIIHWKLHNDKIDNRFHLVRFRPVCRKLNAFAITVSHTLCVSLHSLSSPCELSSFDCRFQEKPSSD